jgi:hypothetical protein
MQITSVNQVLNEIGLASPFLYALVPNEKNYSALLLQPQGEIEADSSGVRNADRDLAVRQFSAFLHDAVSLKAELAVTPEYSMPWDVLEQALCSGKTPGPGSLWVIGCESITFDQLLELQQRLSPAARLICEQLDCGTRRFVDPVAYVFTTSPIDDAKKSVLVVLVQFKTCHMGDNTHFELNGLQVGTRLYCFGDAISQLRLATLICSDAFAFLDEHAIQLYDRTLLIHIQLNEKPRQEQYRSYRPKLLGFQGDATELLCLNWARNVQERQGDSLKAWKNIAGSAWYLRPDKFDRSDRMLLDNHSRGLYYTWIPSLRCHGLFFNYLPASFFLTVTKVAHIGVTASLSRRRGPILSSVRTWDNASSNWAECDSLDDGFLCIVSECGEAASRIADIAQANPIAVERILALSAGQVDDASWYTPDKLDSFRTGPTEVIQRITFCQDDAPEAVRFRAARLRRCAHLFRLLEAAGPLPPSLADMREGASFTWSHSKPHQNMISADGRLATIIYLGEEATESDVECVSNKVAEYISRSFVTHDEVLAAHQRLHVWYRNDTGEIASYDFSRYVRYDEPRTESPFDITRDT